MHMPELSHAFVVYVANIAYKQFIDVGIMPMNEDGLAWLFTIQLFDISRNCRTHEDHDCLVEMAALRIADEYVVGFVEHQKLRFLRHEPSSTVGMTEDSKLVSDLAKILSQCEALQYYVEYWLFENVRELFGERYVVTTAQGDRIIEHPMRIFTQYLNDIEYLKVVDPVNIRCEMERFHQVVILRRAGLAVLPPETWRPRIRLASGALSDAEREWIGRRRMHWPERARLPASDDFFSWSRRRV